MNRIAHLFAPLVVFAGQAAARPQDKPPTSPKRPPAGVYAVLRDGLKEKEVLPLKDGEVLVVNRHRYVKNDADGPPRFLVVRSVPEVAFDLAGEPKALKKGSDVVGVLLQLRPHAATALERLTRDRLGKQLAIVLGGEVVTVHKVRGVIQGGEVQITSCAAGAASYLLEQLRASRHPQ